MQSPNSRHGVACATLNLGDCYFRNKKFLKGSCGSVAIQHGLRAVLYHGAYPPVGPKRSVLMVGGSCPSWTRSLEAFSTKGVGPQTKILGSCSGVNDASASIALSILRWYPAQPLGWSRVSVWTTRKLESRRAIASSSSRYMTSSWLLVE